VTIGYGRLLSRVIQKRILVIALVLLVFGGSSLWMVDQIPQEILPRISTGQARVNARLPAGTTIEDNRRVMQAVDEVLLASLKPTMCLPPLAVPCLAVTPAKIPCGAAAPSPSNPALTLRRLWSGSTAS
jgi:hypothetical protein